MKDIVDGFRKIVQDLLIPEFKALQVEMKCVKEEVSSLKADIKEDILIVNRRIDLLDQEIKNDFIHVNRRIDLLDKEMKNRFDNLQKDNLDLKLTQREILTKLDVDKRITRIETLMDTLLKKAA